MTARIRVGRLSDGAAMVYCHDEREAVRFAAEVRRRMWSWVLDVVQAYTSVAVFFDPGVITSDGAAGCLAGVSPAEGSAGPIGRRHLIPCCYELGPDLRRVAEVTGLTTDAVIARHAGTEYTVYAIGFCPGFPYLGYLPDELAGVPRLQTPRTAVEAGSVGLTGRQTGVYTERRPGGWNLIGRTPLCLVDVADDYFPLRTGDRVRFERVDEAEFARRRGERLGPPAGDPGTSEPISVSCR